MKNLTQWACFCGVSLLAFGCSSDTSTSAGADASSGGSDTGGAAGTSGGGAGGKATGGTGGKSTGGGGGATGGSGGKGTGGKDGGSGGTTDAGSDAGAGKIAHVFYIMMENHAEDEIIGNTADAPYLNQLANKYGVATNYYGVTHPSLPNYLAAVSGDFQGIWDDCKAGQTVTCAPEEFVPGSGDNTAAAPLTPAQVASATAQAHWFSGQNIVDQLEAHSLTWKAYMQSMPTSDPTVEYSPVDTLGDGGTVPRKLYAQKHNPFMYFSDIRSSTDRMKLIVPFSEFDTDLGGTVPNFVWISPDQCNDMHGLSTANATAVNIPNCASPSSGLDHAVIKLGDDFIKATVEKIMASAAWKENSVIFIAWDEDDYAGFAGCCESPTGATVDGGTTPVVLGGAKAPALVITSKNAKHQSVATPFNHYSALATIESLWGLDCLGKACNITASNQMTSLFVP